MCIYVHGKLPVTDIVRHSIIFTDLKVTTREFDIVSSKQSGSLEGLCLANGAAILIETTTPIVGHAAAENCILDSSSESSAPTPGHVDATDVHQTECISVGPRHAELVQGL